MCRSQADGGRRCPGHVTTAPPADGQARIEVVTNKRTYSVIGGQSKVAWMPGEKVISMDIIDPHKPVPCGMCGGSGTSRLVPTKTCQRCGGSGVDPYASR